MGTCTWLTTRQWWRWQRNTYLMILKLCLMTGITSSVQMDWLVVVTGRSSGEEMFVCQWHRKNGEVLWHTTKPGVCSPNSYYVCDNNTETSVPLASSSVSQRVAVYVDCPAGFLSFYKVSSGKLIYLHTFSARLTGPLYAEFGFGSSGLSLSLCSV